jgi:hypothetical protein
VGCTLRRLGADAAVLAREREREREKEKESERERDRERESRPCSCDKSTSTTENNNNCFSTQVFHKPERYVECHLRIKTIKKKKVHLA